MSPEEQQRIADLTEAYRRGILPPDKKAEFEEAGRRGLIELPPDIQAQLQQGPVEEAGPPSVMDKMTSRFLGTDVDDPVPGYRAMGTVGAAMTGAKIGNNIGGMVPPINPFINPMTGRAVGTMLGGVGGALFGSVSPEIGMEAAETVGLLPEGQREESLLSDEEMKTVVEGEALVELATLGLAGTVRAGGRYAIREAGGLGKGSDELAEQASKQGIDLRPFQLGSRELLRGTVNVLGRFPFVGMAVKKAGIATDKAVKNLKMALPGRVGTVLSSSDLGMKVYKESLQLAKQTSKFFKNEYENLFREADELKVEIDISETLGAVKAKIKDMKASVPRPKPKAEGSQGIAELQGQGIAGRETTQAGPQAASAIEYVDNFLQKNFTNINELQSLRQGDELLTKIDEAVDGAPKEIRKAVYAHLADLRAQLKDDVVRNVDGSDIGARLKELDSQFSQTMTFLFETTAGAKYTTFRGGGLLGMRKNGERATQMSPDKILNSLVDMDSPQTLKELQRLLPQATYNEIAARKLGDAFDKSMIEIGGDGNAVFRKLDVEKLKSSFGIGTTDATRKQAWDQLLRGTGLSHKDLKNITEAVEKIADAPVPDFSSFIARRAVLSGSKSGMISAILPFITLGGAAGQTAGAVIGGLIFFGGSKMLMRAVSDPVTARALKKVLDKEAGKVQKRMAAIRIFRGTLNTMKEQGEITIDEFNERAEMVDQFVSEVYDNATSSAKDITSNAL